MLLKKQTIKIQFSLKHRTLGVHTTRHFQKKILTGIFLFERNIFSDDEFLSSYVTDRNLVLKNTNVTANEKTQEPTNDVLSASPAPTTDGDTIRLEYSLHHLVVTHPHYKQLMLWHLKWFAHIPKLQQERRPQGEVSLEKVGYWQTPENQKKKYKRLCYS